MHFQSLSFFVNSCSTDIHCLLILTFQVNKKERELQCLVPCYCLVGVTRGLATRLQVYLVLKISLFLYSQSPFSIISFFVQSPFYPLAPASTTIKGIQLNP
ncbi:hypothetical protein AMEX_G5738 [Astyanax mexicanus]|uniref:Uncharacterized protein n=1 Tax=Astyanax mexicanus TaxID=7994 RepID=A0A8T2M0Z1_ASTMX|nr:hypothetical protein AMEX_G5738 [Astyanax mexicanus]